jgi:alcohol dehydrogenase class IV
MVKAIAERYHAAGCDLLIAFGGACAIDLAKVARIAIAFEEPIAALSDEEGGAHRITGALPDLYAIPGLLGFASAVSDDVRVSLDTGREVLLSSRSLIPTVSIYDPTLTRHASRADSACAAAGIVARSVEVYLSPRYNPPADGLALDALARVPPILDALMTGDNLWASRELMAAGVNSGLAQQKGLCLQQGIANALASASPGVREPIALGPVLVPELIRFYGRHPDGRCARIKTSLGLRACEALADSLTEFFAQMPVATRLSELHVCASDLPAAADIAVGDRAVNTGPKRLSDQDVLSLLQAVH